MSPSPHLRMETDAVSKMLCFLVFRILCVMCHHQNPLELDVYPLLQILITHFSLTVYEGHIPLPLLLSNEWLIWSVAHINASWNVSKRVGYMNLPDAMPRHAGAILGIKLLHLVYVIPMRTFVFSYTRSSGAHPCIKCNHTVSDCIFLFFSFS
jgi:hypothetical protein